MADQTATIKVGDVVRLKSGGPKMTVAMQEAEPQAIAWCICYTGDMSMGSGKFESVQVHPDALDKIN